MTQQDEIGRHPWGEDPNNQPTDNGAIARQVVSGRPNAGQIFGAIVFTVILVIVYFATGRAESVTGAVKEVTTIINPVQELLEILIPTLFVGAGLTLLYNLVWIPGTNRAGRVLRMVSTFWAGGIVLSLVAYLILGWLMPYAGFGERAIVPGLLLGLAFILGLLSPMMNIWPLNVPDGEIWMLLDIGDHVLAYVGPGLRWVRPIDGFERYMQSGALVIDIDDENFVSHDNFPFRVRANVVCLFNPMNADDTMRVALRNMSRDVLRADLQKEIEFIIQNELLNDLREQIRAPRNFRTVLNRIYIDIKEAVEKRSHMGIRLAPTNPINVTILPTQLVTSAAERLISLEAVTGGARIDDKQLMLGSGALDDRTLRDVVGLAARDGDLNIQFDQEGKVRFLLATGDEIDIGDSLGETLVRAAGFVAGMANTNRETSSADIPDQVVPDQPPPELPDGRDWQEITPPSNQQEAEPAAPKQSEADSSPIYIEPEVIDTEADHDGVFQAKPPRRNPIIPEDIPDDL